MIYVFKTSVKNKKHIIQLSPLLNNLLQQLKWSFDLADCDKVLRIDSKENIALKVIELLTVYKFYYKELK